MIRLFYLLFLLCLPLQLLLSVRPSDFAFPLNAVLAGCLVALCIVAEREWSETPALRSLRSLRFSCHLLGVLVFGCVTGALLPYLNLPADPSDPASKPFSDFAVTLPFVFLLACILLQLTLLMVHRIRKNGWRKDTVFLLVHGGLWLALLAGFAGSADYRDLRTLLPLSSSHLESRNGITTAYDREGRTVPLAYSLQTTGFRIKRSPTDGSVVQYEADISIDCAPSQCVAVNSPLTPRWNENLYLVSYDQHNPSPTYVVVQIVRQPWKHLLLAGIAMLMLGTLLFFGRSRKTSQNIEIS
ncbi:MAG: hypothetical protein ACI3YC_01915 [Alloprevotella sp.]